MPLGATYSHLRCVSVRLREIAGRNCQVRRRSTVDYFAFVTTYLTGRDLFSLTLPDFLGATQVGWHLTGAPLGVSLTWTGMNHTALATVFQLSCVIYPRSVRVDSARVLSGCGSRLHTLRVHRHGLGDLVPLNPPPPLSFPDFPFEYNLPPSNPHRHRI